MKIIHICFSIVVLSVSSAFCYGVSFYLFNAASSQTIPTGSIHIVGNGLNLSIGYTAGDPDAFDLSTGTYTFTFSATGFKDSTIVASISGTRTFSIGLLSSPSIRFNSIQSNRNFSSSQIIGIYNTQGKLIKNLLSSTSGIYNIVFGNLSAGMYIIQIKETGIKQATRKITIK